MRQTGPWQTHIFVIIVIIVNSSWKIDQENIFLFVLYHFEFGHKKWFELSQGEASFVQYADKEMSPMSNVPINIKIKENMNSFLFYFPKLLTS